MTFPFLPPLPGPRRATRVAARAAVAALLTLALTACAMHTTESFDSATWKSQRGVTGTDNRRGALVGAAGEALEPGMARDAVHALLGAPDSTREDVDVYELGRSPYGVDEEYFEVRYRDGRVASHALGRR